MDINIRIADHDNNEAHAPLLNWLSTNQYIKDNALLTVRPADKDTMGGSPDTIQLALGAAVDIAQLSRVFIEWRRQSAPEAARVAVESGGLTTVLSRRRTSPIRGSRTVL